MLKAFVNEASTRVEITTLGPLLIKSGYMTVIGADMAPVMTYRREGDVIYLPGSSLKGVFRSWIEKVVNSLKPRVACNPLLDQRRESRDERNLYRTSCGQHLETLKSRQHENGARSGGIDASSLYSGSCPVCRMFGSTSYIGRFSVSDAYLDEGTYNEDQMIEHRDGIAIDRLTGGVSAKFDLETVTRGTKFTMLLRLRNFEIWQLGMLFVILKDLQDELITLGSGRSRGLGRVQGGISTHPGGLVLSTPRAVQTSRERADELWGLGRWLHERGESGAYGTDPQDWLKLPSEVPYEHAGVRYTRVCSGSTLHHLMDDAIEAFVQRIQEWDAVPPAEMGRVNV